MRPLANRLLKIALLAGPVAGLLDMKWASSATTLGQALETGAFTPREAALSPDALGSLGRPLVETVNYLLLVWPALAYGLLVAAAVRTLVSPRWIARALGRQDGARAQLTAGLAGAPLMLCSCCVAPVFTSVYGRSRRLGPALGMMIASPALNPAAIALTFLLFSPGISFARLAMGLAAVFGASAGIGRLFRDAPSRLPVEEPAALPPLDTPVQTLRAFAASLAHVAVRTVPLIVAGVLVSVVLARALPPGALAQAGGAVAVTALVALVAVPLALPTFFEVPLALALLAAGAPAGAAAALLFAGPAINLPSLFTVARASSWRLAAALAGGLWAIAFAGGLLST